MNVVQWFLESDPAFRWQAMRNLTDASPSSVATERARVSREGIGAHILDLQQQDGSWRKPNAPVWLPTLFTMLSLRAVGVDPNDPVVDRAVTRLETSLCWSDRECWELRPVAMGGNPFFEGEEEPCINGGVLALGGYFGRPNEKLARSLLDQQLEDGGWNCEAPRSARSSFHTTICVLEGLLAYEQAVESAPAVTAARHRGEDYLLQRELFRRLSTGEPICAEFLELAFPPRYHYDILRALDYFRAAGREPDPRMHAAIRVLEQKRQSDGRWLLDRAYDEALGFTFGEPPGAPSRWNTLRALRVLQWYEDSD